MSSGKKVNKTDAEWRAQLSAESYWVTREKGTEKPFENAYHDLLDDGSEYKSSDKKAYYCNWFIDRRERF